VRDKILRRLRTIRSQVFEHADIAHERAFRTRMIKIRQMNAENPNEHGKQAKFKARFAISRGAKPALAISIKPTSIIHQRPKSAAWGLYFCARVHKFHNLTALLSAA